MESSDAAKYLLVTVHGIRTFGQWQNRLAALVKRKSPDIAVENFSYGYFSVFAFWFPPLRWLAVRAFRRDLIKILSRYPGRMLCIVAHSNGTFLVAKALQQAPEMRDRIDTIILSGSVLRSDFRWGDLIAQLNIRRVVNDCGISDNVLLLSQFFVLFTGMAGRLGVRGMTGTVLVNRYFNGGHSLYFENLGRPSDDFMQLHWLPLIAATDPVPYIDEREQLTPFHGAYIWLIGNADLIKGAVFASLFYTILNVLYLAPRVEAARQSEMRSIEIATSAFTDESFPEIGLKELAAALRNDRGHGVDPHRQLLSYQFPRFVDINAETSRRGIYRIFGEEDEFELISTGRAVYRRPSLHQGFAWVIDDGGLVEISKEGILKFFSEGKYTEPLWKADIRGHAWPAYTEIALEKALPAPLLVQPAEIDRAWLLAANPEQMILAFETKFLKGEGAPLNERLQDAAATLILQVGFKERTIQALIYPGRLPVVSEACGVATLVWSPISDLSTQDIFSAVFDRNMKQFEGVRLPVINLKAPFSTTLRPEWLPVRTLSDFRGSFGNELITNLVKCAKGDAPNKDLTAEILGRGLRVQFPRYRQETELWDHISVVPPTVSRKPVRVITNEDVTQIKPLVTKITANPSVSKRESEPQKTVNGFPVEDPTPQARDEQSSADRLLAMVIAAESNLVNPGDDDYDFRDNFFVRSDTEGYTVIGESQFPNFGMSYWLFCRLHKSNETVRCIDTTVASHREPPIYSSDFRFALLRTEVSLSGQVAHLIDLDTLNEITLPWGLGDFMTAGAFDGGGGELAILDSEGRIGIGRIEGGKLLRKLTIRQSTFSPSNDIFANPSTFSALALLKDQVVLRAAQKNIVALDRTTGRIRWWSRGIGTIAGMNIKIETSEKTGTAFVFDQTVGRLISTHTGAWLSGEISADELAATDKCTLSFSANNRIGRASFDDQGGLYVQVGDCWFVRQRPIEESAVESFLARVDDFAGRLQSAAD